MDCIESTTPTRSSPFFDSGRGSKRETNQTREVMARRSHQGIARYCGMNEERCTALRERARLLVSLHLNRRLTFVGKGFRSATASREDADGTPIPHFGRLGDSMGKLHMLALQPMDPRAPPHPFTAGGRLDFDALLQSKPDLFPGRLLICDTTTGVPHRAASTACNASGKTLLC